MHGYTRSWTRLADRELPLPRLPRAEAPRSPAVRADDRNVGNATTPSQALFGFVSARQFFGLDINPFAVELAKVTMMIARKLAIDELHITEPCPPARQP